MRLNWCNWLGFSAIPLSSVAHPIVRRRLRVRVWPRALTWPPNNTYNSRSGTRSEIPQKNYFRQGIRAHNAEQPSHWLLIWSSWLYSCIWRELLAINCRLNTTHSSRNIRVDCSMGIDSLKDLVAKHHWHEIKCNFRWWKHQQDAFGARNRDEKFSTVRNMIN